jgi:hypothetical protein
VIGTVANFRIGLLEKKTKMFGEAGDDFGQYLADCVLTNNFLLSTSNRAHGVLTVVPERLVPMAADPWEMLQLYSPYLDVFAAPLGAHSTQEHASWQADDQQACGLCLAGMLIPTFHDTVRLKDDGCGSLFVFLAYVYTLHGIDAVRRLKIELVDEDPHVTAWQKAMFRCPNVVCVTEPLVSLNTPVPRTTLLYLNYRNIAASFDNVRAYLVANKVECLLSFSVTGEGYKKDYEKSLITIGRSAKHTIHLKKLPASDRELTTYVITPYAGREMFATQVKGALESLFPIV